MPKLIAPDDLRALAQPYWAALLPDWDVTIGWATIEELGGRARTWTAAALREARVLFAPHADAADLMRSIRHELFHVFIAPVTEPLGRTALAIALEEPLAERWAKAMDLFPAEERIALARAASLPARFRERLTKPAAGLAREGDLMDAQALIDALKTQDGEKALAIVEGWLAEQLKKIMGDAGMPAEEAAPLEGEDAPAMMRRVLKTALARSAAPPVTLADTGFTAKVLERLGEKTEGAALLRLSTLLVNESTADTLSTESDAERRAAVARKEMPRLRLATHTFFGADGKLLPHWLEGTYEDFERSLARLKPAGPPLARGRIEPDLGASGGIEIPDAVRRHAARRGRGTDVEYMQRLARELANGGSVPQES